MRPFFPPQARKERVPGDPGFRRNGRVEFSFLVYTISKNAIAVLWWLQIPSVRGSINGPTGCLGRTRRFENKHEEEGVVNWKSLPAGIGLG